MGKQCPRGYRMNPTTGNCSPVSSVGQSIPNPGINNTRTPCIEMCNDMYSGCGSSYTCSTCECSCCSFMPSPWEDNGCGNCNCSACNSMLSACRSNCIQQSFFESGYYGGGTWMGYWGGGVYVPWVPGTGGTTGPPTGGSGAHGGPKGWTGERRGGYLPRRRRGGRINSNRRRR